MFEFDTNDDAQPILPKRNSASRFQQGSNLFNSGSERKRSLHILQNQKQSNIRRKIDFLNDQDTLTLFPELPSNDTPSVSDNTPSLQGLVDDFKKRGFLDYEIPTESDKSPSGFDFEASKMPIKSSFKNKNNNISQNEGSVNLSNGSPLRQIDGNSLGPQVGGLLKPKKSSFFQKKDQNNSKNSGIFDNSSNLNQKENNFDKYQKAGNEIAVKISRPSVSNQNTDVNSNKNIDLTGDSTFFKNLIQKDKLIDFGDIDNDTENQNSFTNNNNSNTSIPTLPQKNKKARKPFAPKVYDDDLENGNRKNISGALLNMPASNLNDDDTTQNNTNSIVLPKKGVTFGQKKNNNIYEANNSIDTLFIAETVSNQPMLTNLNPEDTNTNMNMSFNRNPNSSINGSTNTSFGRRNNVKFVNNKNNENKSNDFSHFKPEDNDEEDNDVTKADIDPEFESEHSAILPPMDDHNSNKFNNNSIANNYNTSGNNFLFNTNENLSHNSGILKNKNNSRSKLGNSFTQGNGSLILNNNSKIGYSFDFNPYFQSSFILECINGLFSNQLAALSKDMRQKARNQLQLTDSIINRLSNTSMGSSTNNIFSIINENQEVAIKQSSLFCLNSINEILCNIAMLFENKQLIIRRLMHSAKTLKFTIGAAIEELHRPKSTMKDVMDAISRLEGKKNEQKNDENEFIQKYILLKKSLPFKVSSLNSVKDPFNLNKNSNNVLVKCTYRAVEQKMELNNAEILHVKVSKSQRLRKLKNEIGYLMTIVPDFFFDGSKFSCVISSNDQIKDKRIRFAIVVNVPSFYPWCFLSVESIRVDFGVTFEEVKEKVDNILGSSKITAHPLTNLVQALINEYK